MSIRKWQTVLEKKREEQHESVRNTVFILINACGVSIRITHEITWGWALIRVVFLYSHIVYMIAGFYFKNNRDIYVHFVITI